MAIYNDWREKRSGVSVHRRTSKHQNQVIQALQNRIIRLLGPDLAFAGGTQKMEWTISTISFSVKVWISQM
jgi:hypothetical protein